MAEPFDARAYVQSLLPKGAASAAALAAIEPQLNAHGITLQKSSGGDIRGRIYLPNPGGYQYGNAVDLVGQWGQPWTWTDRSSSGPDTSSGGAGRRTLGSMLTTSTLSPMVAGALPQSQPFNWLTPDTAVDPSRFGVPIQTLPAQTDTPIPLPRQSGGTAPQWPSKRPAWSEEVVLNDGTRINPGGVIPPSGTSHKYDPPSPDWDPLGPWSMDGRRPTGLPRGARTFTNYSLASILGVR